MIKFIKLIFYILVIVALIVSVYRYLELDNNGALQKSIETNNLKESESVIRDVIDNKVKTEAKNYVYKNNSYFVSKSNNLCVSLKTNLGVVGGIIECSAQIHTFTARIKTLSNTYYCLDTSGFSTISTAEAGYKEGVSCK